MSANSTYRVEVKKNEEWVAVGRSLSHEVATVVAAEAARRGDETRTVQEDAPSIAAGGRKHTLETLQKRYAERNTAPNPKRIERLGEAIELGANDATLEKLCDAARTSQKDTIVLPPGRYEHLSRGKGWARKGHGASAEWGERESDGYRVGPGRWSVGSSDGFKRKDSTEWIVEHVSVGGQTWTVARKA